MVVAPLRMGGGTRFKVLEAMAAGVPVVATPIGLQGIDAEPERHALVARTPVDFAAAVTRLLDDQTLSRQLAKNARVLSVAYSTSSVVPGPNSPPAAKPCINRAASTMSGAAKPATA